MANPEGGTVVLRASAALTATRLIWSLSKHPGTVPSINLSEIISLEKDKDGRLFHYIVKPANYPKELLEYNPDGLMDVTFYVLDLSMIPVLESLTPNISGESESGAVVVNEPIQSQSAKSVRDKTSEGDSEVRLDLRFPNGNAEWVDLRRPAAVRGEVTVTSNGINVKQTHLRLTKVNETPQLWKVEQKTLSFSWSELGGFAVMRSNGKVLLSPDSHSQTDAFFIKPADDDDRTAWLDELNRHGLVYSGVHGRPGADYDASKTANIPPTLSLVSTRVSNQFAGLFAPHLDGDETIISVGESLWVQYGLRNGRGSAEGVMAVTTKSIVFILNRNGQRVKIPREDVVKSWKSFIVMPNFSEIHFKVRTGEEFSFYATRRMCKEILSLRIA